MPNVITLIGIVYFFFIMQKINNVVKLVLKINFWDAELAVFFLNRKIFFWGC